MATQTYNLDPAHSTLAFTVRHLVVSKVHGRFPKWTAELDFDLEDLSQSRVSVEVDVASIDTQSADRDTHLRSADFFDVEKFPTATFRSTKFEKAGGDNYRIHGDFTLHGVTKPVVLDTEFNGQSTSPWGQQVIGFSATTELNRNDWGLTWNKALETGGVLVGEKIKLSIELEASKAA